MASETSPPDPTAASGNSADTAVLAVDQAAHPTKPPESENAPPGPELPTEKKISSKSAPRPTVGKSNEPSNPVVASTTEASPKAAANKPFVTPPVLLQPSLPISMIVRPESLASASGTSPSSIDFEKSFDPAFAEAEQGRARASLVARGLRSIHKKLFARASRGKGELAQRRVVAFDGFRNDLFEEKLERDRRYGTVYTVSETADAFLVRLELPRRMPKSSLKQTWQLPDEMPDYLCTLELSDNVLSIRAGLPDEAHRRVSYVSSSFPSDFQTRIEFPTRVEGLQHRLRNKMLEIVVYKNELSGQPATIARAVDPKHNG